MAIVIPKEVNAGDPIDFAKINEIISALSFLASGQTSDRLANGSFELDATGVATGWIITDTASASHSLVNAEATRRHGNQGLQINLTANGDVVDSVSSEKIPCAVGDRIKVNFRAKSTIAGVDMKAEVFWWYWDTGTEAWIAATTPSNTAFDHSAAAPTSWRKVAPSAGELNNVRAPSGTHDASAYSIKITISATASGAGTFYMDDVTASVYKGFVAVDESVGAAALAATIPTNTSYTLPSAIIGDEQPHTAVLHVHVESTVGATGTTTFAQNSGGGGAVNSVISWGTASDIDVHVQDFTVFAPVRQSDLSFNVSGTSGTGSITLAGYYVGDS